MSNMNFVFKKGGKIKVYIYSKVYLGRFQIVNELKIQKSVHEAMKILDGRHKHREELIWKI